jgi:hypothetical protein
MYRKECWTMTNKNLGPHLGPHLGAHASRVLPPTTKKSATTNKVPKTPKPSCPSSSLPPDAADNRSAGASVRPLHNTGQSADARPFSVRSLPHAPTFHGHDITAVTRLHISRRNQAGFNPGASAVTGLNNSANSATANQPNREFATGSELGLQPRQQSTEKSVKNSGNSGGIRTRNGSATGSENGMPTRALKPHPDRKIGKHQHEEHEQHRRNMNPGKISPSGMNSMPTHVAIGGVAPGRPLQFECGHCGNPNAMRPQFSTEKSGKNSACSANSAGAAKPTNTRTGAVEPGQGAGVQTQQHSAGKSVKNSGNSGGIRTKNGGAMGWQNGRTTHALKSLPDRQI